jgi:hypothetical protein
LQSDEPLNGFIRELLAELINPPSSSHRHLKIVGHPTLKSMVDLQMAWAVLDRLPYDHKLTAAQKSVPDAYKVNPKAVRTAYLRYRKKLWMRWGKKV